MLRDADNQKLKCMVKPKREGMQDGNAPKDGSMARDGYDTVERAQPGRERFKPSPYNYYD